MKLISIIKKLLLQKLKLIHLRRNLQSFFFFFLTSFHSFEEKTKVTHCMLKGEESRLIESGFIYVCRSHFDMNIFC